MRSSRSLVFGIMCESRSHFLSTGIRRVAEEKPTVSGSQGCQYTETENLTFLYLYSYWNINLLKNKHSDLFYLVVLNSSSHSQACKCLW